MIYGKNLEDTKTTKSMMFSIVVDGLSSNLNLTTMVESKQDRVVTLRLNSERTWKPSPRTQDRSFFPREEEVFEARLEAYNCNHNWTPHRILWTFKDIQEKNCPQDRLRSIKITIDI